MEPPDGYAWQWIGTCSCRGQDKDCADDDRLWRLIPASPEVAEGEQGDGPE